MAYIYIVWIIKTAIADGVPAAVMGVLKMIHVVVNHPGALFPG